jgi:hypothetical protein
MQTYKDYIESTNINKNFNEVKPVFRSSAIFPFILSKKMNTNIYFLGYWLMKRRIDKIALLITIRDSKGNILTRQTNEINQVKAYTISLQKILPFKIPNSLFGSIELEIFSIKDMVYPYPAFVLNFEGEKTSCVVHTCGRIYNNYDDQINNTNYMTEESGFDIIHKKNYKPFFSFVNGGEKILNKNIRLTIINQKGLKKNKYIKFKAINPYETKIVKFLTENEKKFLKNSKGTVKIKHNFKSFFPRFLSGNLNKNLDESLITHTYYDLSKLKGSDQYFLNKDKKNYYDSNASVPLFFRDKFYTELAVYPNLNPSNFYLNLEVYENTGKIISKIINIINVSEKLNHPIYLNLNKIIEETKIELNKKKNYFCRIYSTSKKKIPWRIKFALNICNYAQNSLPSNVCFNLQVSEKSFLKKKGIFKWGLIQNKHHSLFTLSNIGLSIKNNDAKIKLKFFNEFGNKCIEKNFILKKNASLWFDLNKEKKIKKFLNKRCGWFTAQCQNPNVSGWYFEIMKNKSVGADHLF